jgi:hypothetical protein
MTDNRQILSGLFHDDLRCIYLAHSWSVAMSIIPSDDSCSLASACNIIAMVFWTNDHASRSLLATSAKSIPQIHCRLELTELSIRLNFKFR